MKVVRITDLKAHLSEHLRQVRSGVTVAVTDRGTTIARLVPADAADAPLSIRPPKRLLRSVRLPPRIAIAADIVAAALAAERQGSK